MSFLATSVDINVFKLIEGFCACIKPLNDLLCNKIAKFLLEIFKLLSTLLLLLIAFLTNVVASIISCYLMNVTFKGATSRYLR